MKNISFLILMLVMMELGYYAGSAPQPLLPEDMVMPPPPVSQMKRCIWCGDDPQGLCMDFAARHPGLPPFTNLCHE